MVGKEWEYKIMGVSRGGSNGSVAYGGKMGVV